MYKRQALKIFLQDRLRLSSATLAKMGDISIKKVFAAPSAKIQDEVIALFESQEICDTVRRVAKELAGEKDAGIRLEIPRYLQSSLKSLEAVSFALKKKNPEMKRNIKFDDDYMDLVLDFCLRGQLLRSGRSLGRPRRLRSSRDWELQRALLKRSMPMRSAACWMTPWWGAREAADFPWAAPAVPLPHSMRRTRKDLGVLTPTMALAGTRTNLLTVTLLN